MRHLIPSHSAVQRKSLSSFYHSSLSPPFFPCHSVVFSLTFSHQSSLHSPICWLFFPIPVLYVQPRSSSHLRHSGLQIAYLHVCVLAVWAPSCQNLLCTRARVLVPFSVSACICVLAKKACMVKVCVLCNFLFGVAVGLGPKIHPNEFFKNNLLSVLSGCEKS